MANPELFTLGLLEPSVSLAAPWRIIHVSAIPGAALLRDLRPYGGSCPFSASAPYPFKRCSGAFSHMEAMSCPGLGERVGLRPLAPGIPAPAPLTWGHFAAIACPVPRSACCAAWGYACAFKLPVAASRHSVARSPGWVPHSAPSDTGDYSTGRAKGLTCCGIRG